MINSKDLWNKRVTQFVKEVSKYLRYMLNDHLLIALVFFAGGAAYYYNRWLEEIPVGFPFALIIAIFLSIVLTNSTVQTLLKEPDLVFLIPVEKKLDMYFQKAILFSLFVQSYLLLIVFAIITPLYLRATDNSLLEIGLLFVVVILAKVWNLMMTWNMQYFNEDWVKPTDIIVRLFLNFALCYFLFSSANIFFTIVVIILMVGLFLYFQKAATTKTVKWDLLIELESKKMLTFYRLANLFTDVPKLKEKVKRRRWLDWATRFIGYSKASSFNYLFFRTFLRSSDYFGTYIRLTIIGGLTVYFLEMEYGKIVIILLFLYLTGYQLMTLWRHHSLKIWIQLYPIVSSTKKQSFLKLLMYILITQSLLLAGCVAFNGQLLVAAVAIAFGVGFSYLFVFYYIKGKIQKMP